MFGWGVMGRATQRDRDEATSGMRPGRFGLSVTLRFRVAGRIGLGVGGFCEPDECQLKLSGRTPPGPGIERSK